MKYKLSEIAEITGGELFGSDNTVTSVSIDSRNHCAADSLFVAISGENHDGHFFIKDLEARGVRAFLVERLDSKSDDNIGFVVVEDSLRALQTLAAHHRERYKGTVVAITGSNGKTIVKEWIAGLWLTENGRMMRSPRSYNSQVGVPLSLLMIEGDERIAVIEAGISKPGEMERLEEMIHPDIVLFTNMGPAHGENFESLRHKYREKQILFKRAKTIIKAPTEGDAEEQNMALALGLYAYLKLPHASTDVLQPVAMRLEVQEGILGSLIINDSYNSDIASLGIALDFAARQGGEKRVLILSDIAGADESTYKQVSQMIIDHHIGVFIGVGEHLCRYRRLFSKVENTDFYLSTEDCLASIPKGLIRDSVVLLKGGRSFGFERLSSALESRTHTTVLEVDLTAMAANLNRHRAMLAPQVKTMAMVKASGYGSGTVEVAAMLQHQRVDYLAVAFADEGVQLRRGGIHLPIVVLNADNGSFAAMIEHSLEPEIYSLSSLRQYIQEVKRQGSPKIPVHIKLDTGMHRLGFMEDEIEELCNILEHQNAIYVGSIFSHLAASEDPKQDNFTNNQILKFTKYTDRIIARLQPLQPQKILRHICNSAAIARFPEAHFDMVRLGIRLYSDSPEGNNTVCRLFTRIVQIKSIPAGDTVGYNRLGTVDTPKRIAILPLGYADGLSRQLGCGKASFNINGTLCPTIGNICMDTTIIDITNATKANEGDRVEIFGHHPTLAEISTARETIEYEILTSISSRIKRIYITE